MRRWGGLVVLALVAGACGGASTSTTSPGATVVSTTSTTPPGTTVAEVPEPTSTTAAETTTTTTSTTTTNTTTTSTTQPPPEPRSLTDGIVEVEGLLREPTVRHDRDTIPRLELITIEPEDEGSYVTVRGASGAVPYGVQDASREDFKVLVHNLEWDTFDCVDRQEDGSFTARVEAPPGSTLYVMPRNWGNCLTGEAGVASVLSLPRSASVEAGSFTTHGLIASGSVVRWSAHGSIDGSNVELRFELPDGPPDGCIRPGVRLYRLFDGAGEYVTQVNLNVHGPVLTPTGLPIESIEGIEGYYEEIEFDDVPRCLDGVVDLTFSVDQDNLEAGWYLPRLVFGEWWGDTTEGFGIGCLRAEQEVIPIECDTGNGFLPMLDIGGAETPRIPATLLNQAASWGAAGILGVVAKEDEGRFALGSRRAAQAPFIASPHDPLSGRSLHYTIEPYLPTVGYTGFADLLPDLLFSLDSTDPGWVTVEMTTPDGVTRVLADEALVQMFISNGDGNGYPTSTSFAGPSHTVGLTAFGDDLDVIFDQYGRYTVHVEGALLSSRGDEFIVEGTYDIWVAEPLDLSLGVFEGTPLEVGDAFNPVVIVEPGVPAEVTIDITHYVDGDVEQRQVHSVSGTANEYGYFASPDAWEPSEHGEYRVDVMASYVDPIDGTLWMGARSSASIVATPDTPVIAHGERNKDFLDLDAGQVPRIWYFFRSFDPECPPVSGDCDGGGMYPFFTGDVMWLTDGRPLGPTITVDVPADVLERVAPDLMPHEKCSGSGRCVAFEDERVLVPHREEGRGAHYRPDDVTSWAYWYSSSIRADVSVFHAATAWKSQHNSWYGTDSYNCQIGLPCFGALMGIAIEREDGNSVHDEFSGDEEGDLKLTFGGAVLRTEEEQHFAPYASFAVLTRGGNFEDGVLVSGDEKGDRVCPPYQGAAGGLGTCGPILTHRGREVDLFITPTGTRPGSVLEPGDLFTFSGQVWPTLDVAVEVVVTTPSGAVHEFADRANVVGYVDPSGMSFVVDEPGVYEVHVSATQDLPVPSTGLVPDPVFVADGRTTMDVYGYEHPLSAVLGAQDSAYRFFVVEGRAEEVIEVDVDSDVLPSVFSPTLSVGQISFSHPLPDGVTGAHVSLTAPGLVLVDEVVSAIDGSIEVSIIQEELDEAGFTQIRLGADTLQLSIAYETADGWEAQILNQRGFSPLGGRVGGAG